MKPSKSLVVTHWIFLILFSLMILMGVYNYFFQTEMVASALLSINYPSYLPIPLGIIKLIGLIMILTKKFKTLEEWSYAGFFYVLTLGLFAHLVVKDGQFMGAVIALILFVGAYGTKKIGHL